MKECDIKKIQSTQIRIMDEIHRICVEKGYRYYLIGGSALGAVRHNGIIPWDVDIDIAMPRKDYELLLSEGCKNLAPEFSLHSHNTDANFGTVHALIVLNNSDIQFSYELGVNLNSRYGIFVDVLPLDQWPDDPKQKEKQIKKIKRIIAITNFHAGALIREEDSFTESFIKKAIKCFLNLFISRYKLNCWLQNTLKKYQTVDEGTSWCSMTSHYSFDKLTMPKSYFGTPRLHEFSARSYFVPEKVEEYLSHLFGDYMKEPSEESKRNQMNSIYSARWIDVDGKEICLHE